MRKKSIKSQPLSKSRKPSAKSKPEPRGTGLKSTALTVAARPGKSDPGKLRRKCCEKQAEQRAVLMTLFLRTLGFEVVRRIGKMRVQPTTVALAELTKKRPKITRKGLRR